LGYTQFARDNTKKQEKISSSKNFIIASMTGAMTKPLLLAKSNYIFFVMAAKEPLSSPN